MIYLYYLCFYGKINGEMVRSERLELSRVLPHSDLNAARLPFRHDRTAITWWRLSTRRIVQSEAVFTPNT